MGKVDVTDILADPDFVEPCILIHRQPAIDIYGENVLNERGVPTFGIIEPASGKTLQRLPDLFRVANVMSFWILGNIVSDGTCRYPDVISYRGSRFAVQVVFDWSSWGAGWAEGTCVRQPPTL